MTVGPDRIEGRVRVAEDHRSARGCEHEDRQQHGSDRLPLDVGDRVERDLTAEVGRAIPSEQRDEGVGRLVDDEADQEDDVEQDALGHDRVHVSPPRPGGGLGLREIFDDLPDALFGPRQSFAAEADQLGGALDLLAEHVDVGGARLDRVEDLLQFGGRLGVGQVGLLAG